MAEPSIEPASRPLASIIVLNWNGREFLEKYLPHVVELTRADDPGHEVILVDNGSTDGSVELVRQAQPSVRLVTLSTNTGFSFANNRGAEVAVNPVIILLNNDVQPTPGFLAPVLQHFRDPSVFAVAMKSLVPKRNNEEEAVRKLAFTRGWFQTESDPAVVAGRSEASPILYACGGMVALHRDRYRELGGLDEMFSPIYWEDVDLSLRGWRRGWKVLYEPRSVVYHQHASTTARPDFRREAALAALKNHHLLLWKHLDEAGPWLEYVFWQAVRLARSALTLDAVPFIALWRAFRQLDELRRGRARERAQSQEGGVAVLRRHGAVK
ncbi:MAG: glycosyltransferase family 2 protein [Candidatus Riflebacteria bacterium]|nr:glycosyltransferase family 2 protein [Candidatus Riflebacteria bacterium]